MYQSLKMLQTVLGNSTIHITFFLSGEDLNKLKHQLQTHPNNQYMMPSINSNKQYKLGTQQNKNMLPLCIPGMSEGESLQTKLLKECMKTSQLIQLSKQIALPPKKGELQALALQPSKKSTKKKHHVSRSSAKKISSKKRRKRKTSSSSSSSSSNSSKTSNTTSSN
ncbi:ORF4 [Small anellovirus 2]|uniref:hypothetical protein n=1 Tax=Small anellovirus 2 TaxID=289367 RepID=UPI000050B7C5|nr:hypothetical protein SAV2_gp4 [Small anellovirus 2]AAU88151.1 ORF4 [Small anellovirus 2]